MDSPLLIPQHISRIGLYSGQIVLLNSIASYYYDYYLLASLLFVLYITTLIHWNKIYKNGMVKTLDIIFALLCMLSVTFRDSLRFTPEYAALWYASISTSIVVFVVNECLLYYQLSLPMITDKTYIYNISVVTHIIFLHFMPNITCVICVAGSSAKSQLF
jgi:hypothetical protein